MIQYKRPTAPESVRQLYDYIAFHHEQFCKTDDADKKSEALRLLKGYASEYLNQVVHTQKFKTPAVESVLTQSALLVDDFDPREASEAFEHLAKYGQNLLDQPWRPEFKVLYLSSGYYIHNVQAYLENAHEILIAMGYANIDDDTLQLARLPNSSFLKEVSRDCFVASQECLILSQIWDYVRSQLKNCDILPAQVYQYRRMHIGDVSTIGKKICYDIHQRQHDEYLRKEKLAKEQPPQQRNGYDINCPVDCLVDVGDNGLKKQKSGDLPERELARNVLHYTQRQQENIYDPVPIDEYHAPGGNFLSPTSPSINSSSSNFMYNVNGDPPSFVYPGTQNGYLSNTERYPTAHNPPDFGLPPPQQIFDRTRSSTSSPYIPKTVSSFRGSSFENRENYKPSNSSSSSSSSRGQLINGPKHFETKKLSLNELRRLQGSDSSCVEELNFADIEKVKQPKPSEDRSRQPLSSTYNNATTNGKSYRHPDNSAAKYMYRGSSNSAEEDSCLRDALEYRHGVQNLVQNYKPSSIENYSKYSPHEKELLPSGNNPVESRMSMDRESITTSSSSSETSSWGYNKQPSVIANPGVRGDHEVPPTRSKPAHRSKEGNRFEENPRNGKSVEYETEYQREYKGKAPLETNLDSLQTVFFNQLLQPSSSQHDIAESARNSRPDPNVISTDRRIKQGHKAISDVTDGKEKVHNIRVQLEYDDSSEDPYGKKRTTTRDEGKPKSDRSQRSHKVKESHDMDIPQEIQAWQCPHCTYVNHISGNICDMCAKSKDFVFEEEAIPPVLKLDTSTVKKQASVITDKSSKPSASQDKRSYSSVTKSASTNFKEDRNKPSVSSESTDTPDHIACPQCTYLNPKTLVSCEICTYRLKNTSDH